MDQDCDTSVVFAAMLLRSLDREKGVREKGVREKGSGEKGVRALY